MKKFITPIICILLAGVIGFSIVSLIKQNKQSENQEILVSSLNLKIEELQQQVENSTKENETKILELENTIEIKNNQIKELQNQIDSAQSGLIVPDGYYLVTYEITTADSFPNRVIYKYQIVEAGATTSIANPPTFTYSKYTYAFSHWNYKNGDTVTTINLSTTPITQNLTLYAIYDLIASGGTIL